MGGCEEQQGMPAAGADDVSCRQGGAGMTLVLELLWPAAGNSLEGTNTATVTAVKVVGAGMNTVTFVSGGAGMSAAADLLAPSSASHSSASSCGPAASSSGANVSSSCNATAASSSATNSGGNSVACVATLLQAAATKGTRSARTSSHWSHSSHSGSTISGNASSSSSGSKSVGRGLVHQAAVAATATGCTASHASASASASGAAAGPVASHAGGSTRRIRAFMAPGRDETPQGGIGGRGATCCSAANPQASHTPTPTPTTGTSATVATTTTTSRTACSLAGSAAPALSSPTDVDTDGSSPPGQRNPHPVELRAYCRTTGAVPLNLHANAPVALGPDPTASATASSYSACTAVRYCASLSYLPRGPGLLVLELSGASLAWEHMDTPEPVPAWGPGSPCGCSGTAATIAAVPVVLVGNERTARELQAVVDGWYGGQRELDELLYDVGAMLGEAAEAEAAGRPPDSRWVQGALG